jgi:hypothetical protein
MISKIVSVVAGVIWKHDARALMSAPPHREAAKPGARS